MKLKVSKSTRKSGTGFIGWFEPSIGWLTLIFIAAKLTGYITWSWFWVLSPMIFLFGTILFVIIIMGVVLLFW